MINYLKFGAGWLAMMVFGLPWKLPESYAATQNAGAETNLANLQADYLSVEKRQLEAFCQETPA